MPRLRRREEEEVVLPAHDGFGRPVRHPREAQAEAGAFAHGSETVPPFLALPVDGGQVEEAQEHGERRRHAGGVAEHEEALHDAPPVGRELGRRDAEVGERLAEEAVQREAQPGLQRARVHADGPRRRRRVRAQVAGGARGVLVLGHAVLVAERVDLGLRAQGRGEALDGRGPGQCGGGGGGGDAVARADGGGGRHGARRLPASRHRLLSSLLFLCCVQTNRNGPQRKKEGRWIMENCSPPDILT